MRTDLALQFHKGTEFTKRSSPHVHCIIHALVPESRSYIVEYTATGNIKKLYEDTLTRHYLKSTHLAQRSALDGMGSGVAGGPDADEDGESWSP
jgi:hypothetical protein